MGECHQKLQQCYVKALTDLGECAGVGGAGKEALVCVVGCVKFGPAYGACVAVCGGGVTICELGKFFGICAPTYFTYKKACLTQYETCMLRED